MKRFTALRTVLASLLVLTVYLGAADYLIDDSLALRTSDSLPSGPTVTVSAAGITIPVSENTQVVYEARLFGVLPLKRVAVQRFDDGLTLCPGGTVFGAKMFTDGLAVIGFSAIDCTDGSARPAYDAGMSLLYSLAEGKFVPSSNFFISACGRILVSTSLRYCCLNQTFFNLVILVTDMGFMLFILHLTT